MGMSFQNRFPNRAREEQNRREGGRDSGAGADRERQRRERMQQQRKGQWSSYFDNRNAPRIIYNSSVCPPTFYDNKRSSDSQQWSHIYSCA